MIFVCLGTQIYQFDRLLKEIDRLIEIGIIDDNVFAQVGTINYVPKHFSFKQYLSYEEFDGYQSRASLIISHDGTGSLIGASKKGQNIIAVPRLSKFGEHLDDHQIQIVTVLESEGYIRAVYDIDDLGDAILEAKQNPITRKYQRESNVVPSIESFIESIKK